MLSECIHSVLGTSGQNIDDAFKYVDADTPLTLAERCMFWRHIAPSAPDTLCTYFLYHVWGFGKFFSFNLHFSSFSLQGCYPFQDQDPFIVEQSPHVYFVGNQSKFEHSLVEGKTHHGLRWMMEGLLTSVFYKRCWWTKDSRDHGAFICQNWIDRPVESLQPRLHRNTNHR